MAGSPVTFISNIASLRAARSLDRSSVDVNRSLERLSSGQRINRAADDAAGLAIASQLNARGKVFQQGIRNANDGLSFLAIAEAATGELVTITTRIIELAEQAANGTYSGRQRAALDNEAQALANEYIRILRSTEFNDVNVFESSSELAIQIGYGTTGSIRGTTGGLIGTGTFADRAEYSAGGASSPRTVAVGDIDNDGNLDVVTGNAGSNSAGILLGERDGTFQSGSPIALSFTPSDIELADFNNDGFLDMVAADLAGDSVKILLGNGSGSFGSELSLNSGNAPVTVKTADFNGDGHTDIATFEDAFGGGAGIGIFLGNGTGTFGARTSFLAGSGPDDFAIADVNGDGRDDLVVADAGANTVDVRLGTGDGSFSAVISSSLSGGFDSVAVGDFTGDGNQDIVTVDISSDVATIAAGNGSGSFQVVSSYAMGTSPVEVVAVDFNGDGKLDIASADRDGASVTVRLGEGSGTFGAKSTYTVGASPRDIEARDLNRDGILDLVTADSGAHAISVLLAQTTSGGAALLDFSLKTRAGGLQSLTQMTDALERLTQQLGTIGAFSARLNYAINNNHSLVLNSKAAESRIVDADVAVESAELAAKQILLQSGAAVLAQANQQPALLLSLLKP